MKKCRACGKEYRVLQYQAKNADYICGDCRRAYDKAWRDRRKEAGLRTGGSKTWNPAKKKKWLAEYYARPDIKKRKAEAMRKYATDPKLRARHEARWQISHLLASGKLVRGVCAVCGVKQTEAHHPDYYKPLEVIWLCPTHHRAEHAKAEGRA